MSKTVYITNTDRIFSEEMSGREFTEMTPDEATNSGFSGGIFDIGNSDTIVVKMPPKSSVANIVDILSIDADESTSVIIVTDYNRSTSRIEKLAKVVKRIVPDNDKFVPFVKKWLNAMGLPFNEDFSRSAINASHDPDLALSAVIQAARFDDFDDSLIPQLVTKQDVWAISDAVCNGDVRKAVSLSSAAGNGVNVNIPLVFSLLGTLSARDRGVIDDDLGKGAYFKRRSSKKISDVSGFSEELSDLVHKIDDKESSLAAIAGLADKVNK